MKKLICNLFLLCCIAYSSYAQQGYVIKGTVEGMADGKVNIVVYKKGTQDTLGSVPFKNGMFEMRGSISGVIPATLQIGGQTMGGATIFLENKEYTAKLNPGNIAMSDIQGSGESQRLWNEYKSYEVARSKAIDGIREEFLEAIRVPGDPRLPGLKSYMDSLGQVVEEQQKVFLKKHATSYITLDHLAMNAERFTLEELQANFSMFSPEMQNSFSGKMVEARISKLEEMKSGKVAPDFTVQTPEGKSFNLHSVKAKLILIDFWASWCAPCRAMIPELKKLYADFRDKGFEIVSISMDDKKDYWIKAIKDEGMSWIQGSDLSGNGLNAPIVKLYGIYGIPHLVLIDQDNRILATNLRGKELYEAVADFFKKK